MVGFHIGDRTNGIVDPLDDGFDPGAASNEYLRWYEADLQNLVDRLKAFVVEIERRIFRINDVLKTRKAMAEEEGEEEVEAIRP
jgi:hypothetical protein